MVPKKSRIPKFRNQPIIKLFYSLRKAGHNLRENQNIDLVNVGVQRDKLVIGLRDHNNRRKIASVESLPGEAIRKFIDQILHEYFKVCEVAEPNLPKITTSISNHSVKR